MGFAVSAAGMPVIIASLTRLLPEAQRGRATGLGTAGSSFGQFLVVPLVRLGISGFGWQAAMLLIAAVALLMIPLALPLNDRPAAARPAGARRPSRRPAGAARARCATRPSGSCPSASSSAACMSASWRSTCPGFVASCHLPTAVGAAAISLIGLFNIAGSLLAGRAVQPLEAAGAAGGDLRRRAAC